MLDAGDVDGACNRAYYAMFDAAKASLLLSGASVEHVKTHSGLISAFSLHLVRSGHLSAGLGRALNRVEEMRLVADYTGGEVPADMAMSAVEQATAFFEAIELEFAFPKADGKPGTGSGAS